MRVSPHALFAPVARLIGLALAWTRTATTPSLWEAQVQIGQLTKSYGRAL